MKDTKVKKIKITLKKTYQTPNNTYYKGHYLYEVHNSYYWYVQKGVDLKLYVKISRFLHTVLIC